MSRIRPADLIRCHEPLSRDVAIPGNTARADFHKTPVTSRDQREHGGESVCAGLATLTKLGTSWTPSKLLSFPRSEMHICCQILLPATLTTGGTSGTKASEPPPCDTRGGKQLREAAPRGLRSMPDPFNVWLKAKLFWDDGLSVPDARSVAVEAVA